jgi:PDZ domain-containing protein
MRLRYLVIPVVIVAVALGALWTVPADDFIFTPDRAKPLADRVVVEGAKPAAKGDVYYVDVFVRRTTWLENLLPFTRPEGSTVIPEQDLLPDGTSEEERNRENRLAMEQSKVIASAVALRALGYDVKITSRGAKVVEVGAGAPADGKLEEGDVIVAVDGEPIRTLDELSDGIGRRKPGEPVRLTARRDGRTVTVTVGTVESQREPGRPVVGIIVTEDADIDLPFDVDIDLGQVGGPSAGLPFALEIARMLGRDVTHGCVVAATGELGLDGSVLAVGGLKQKTIGARRSDVDVFVVPAGTNAEEARKYAEDLPVIAVESYQQALQRLATAPVKC